MVDDAAGLDPGTETAGMDRPAFAHDASPAERGRVSIALTDEQAQLAIDLVMKDALREKFRDTERTVLRRSSPDGFHVAVEAYDASLSVESIGRRIGTREAAIHSHIRRDRNTACFKLHYVVMKARRGLILTEDREERMWTERSDGPVFGPGQGFNPFNLIPSRRIRNERGNYLRALLEAASQASSRRTPR